MRPIAIQTISEQEAIAFGSKYRKEHVDFKPNGKTHYLAACAEGKILGVVGWQQIGSVMRYKSDVVAKQYRGDGIYSELFKEREIQTSGKCQRTTAYCTQMSLPMYLKYGFRIVSVNKNNITFVKR